MLLGIRTMNFQVMCCKQLVLHLLSSLLVLGVREVQSCYTVAAGQQTAPGLAPLLDKDSDTRTSAQM